jgi:4-amino-4-deoxy-L-arabinose transferase-like glycosyltransferase
MLTALGTGTIFSARIISTDVPLLLFLSVALFAYVRLLQDFDWRWALALGIAIGAGLLAKYAMSYFLVGMFVVAIFDLRARALWARCEFWLTLATATLIVSPNLYWNAANGFISLRWAGNNVVGEKIAPSLIRGLEFLAAQFAVFGPVVFGVSIAAGSRFGSKQLVSVPIN